MEQILFIIIGLLVGIIGSLAGVGGGFILIPILVLLYPDLDHTLITTISLAVIMLNSISGSISFAKQKRIDYKTATILALATVPSAVFGSTIKGLLPENTFKIILGLLLIFVAIFTIFKREKTTENNREEEELPFWKTKVNFVDKFNKKFNYSYNWVIGSSCSMIYGALAGMLGIGGGVFQVPTMIHLLNVPVHIATATSRFLVIFMATATTITNLFSGYLSLVIYQVVFIGLGAIFGAQIGAQIAKNIKSTNLMRFFAVIIIISGSKILISGLS